MPEHLSLILLAGGQGTRLRAVHPELPKPMVPVAGRPFLEWSLRYWIGQGVNDFVVSTGYRSQEISRFLATAPIAGARIRESVEAGPLGTGGAIRACLDSADCGDPFLVANGDSLLLADLRGCPSPLSLDGADAVMLAVPVEDASRFGSVAVSAAGNLSGFREKRPGSGLINAGVYVLTRRLVELFPPGEPLSLENDVFPLLLNRGVKIKVKTFAAPFLDIGTPESLAGAEQFILTNRAYFET